MNIFHNPFGLPLNQSNFKFGERYDRWRSHDGAYFDAVGQLFAYITGKELVVKIETEKGLVVINGIHKFGDTKPLR